MNFSILHGFGAFALLSLPANPAFAQMDLLAPGGPCQLEIFGDSNIEWRGLYGRGYDVTEKQQDFMPLSLSIRHQGAPCDYFIVATPSSSAGENALTNGGEKLYWDLLRDTSGATVVSSNFQGTLDTQLSGMARGGASIQPITLFFTILPSQFVRGGFYSGQLIIRLFRSNGNSAELVSEMPVSLVADVLAILEVRSDNFPTGLRETSIDLGDLNLASRRRIDFDLVSNAAVGIGFTSRNRGKLAHQFGAPGVPYSLWLNGAEVPLDTPSRERLDMIGAGGNRGASIEIDVPASQTSRAAGHYTDALTITFTADP